MGRSYRGERINLGNMYSYEKKFSMNGNWFNDCAFYQGKLLFVVETGHVWVLELNTDTWTKINLGDTSLKPHANSVVFGDIISGDLFPLVYANAYNTAGLPKGTCYLIRMSGSTVATLTASVIQTIKVGFVDDPLWMNENDSLPYGNFVVDTVNRYLYAFTLRDTDYVTRFFKFNLPDRNAGNVTLTTDDIIEWFDVPYMVNIQGCELYNGKIYCASGLATSASPCKINVVNPDAHSLISIVDIDKSGITDEIEGLTISNSGMICTFTNTFGYNFNFS
jgi:hypothetical protein